MKSVIIGSYILILFSAQSCLGQDSAVNSRIPFPDTGTVFHPHLYLSFGIGYEFPQRYNPIFFTHVEGTGGLSCYGKFEFLYRYEYSGNADPYNYQNLRYSSNVWINSVALRYYFVNNFFASMGAGYALGTTDSATDVAGDVYGEAKFGTPVISASAGWSNNTFYIEYKGYFGTRRIQAYGESPVAFDENTLGLGIIIRRP
jgi:hypothetical protein